MFCCALRGTVPTTTCATEANCPDSGSVECISPADCASGQVCCGPTGTSQPLGTKCMSACTASGYLSRQVCLTIADCPNAMYTCPTGNASDSTGGLFKTCHPPVAEAGTTPPADAGTE